MQHYNNQHARKTNKQIRRKQKNSNIILKTITHRYFSDWGMFILIVISLVTLNQYGLTEKLKAWLIRQVNA